MILNNKNSVYIHNGIQWILGDERVLREIVKHDATMDRDVSFTDSYPF